ncbi:alpha-L-arabinofuranosidase [Melioribacter roseus P3M-2]|uniref:non-reducing end alpha-L-arabinofuranosidase n=1 Tax=Melioribacter roseus (strain DSM 23840 / JCM 17771 / VKM B-2668 / P3M-2) TaxID=1191523 RepID=I6YWL1_MELRP|nr:alpha-N-arabinofuranosidase [Melioribacter roseus]AFN74942.1 alpha-L-arabinofuranosidase [Melioribacter roseus P3M-2]
MQRVIIFFLILFVSLNAQNKIVINADLGKYKIDKNIYGHFSEHLGRCIYDGFYVGDTNKIIPNTRGIRNDIVKALRKMKVPVLRWPGGCFADTYHWKDGIGPRSERPTIVNTWWGGVTEDNSFGTHEFMDLCEQLGAEPYISGNVGSGTVREMAEWVQYTNFDGRSPMSDLRKKNGREKPWNVKYWGIGNETWGCGGHMRPEYYADIYRAFATYLPGNSNVKLFRIASGAAGDDYNWTEVLLKNIPLNLIEGIGVHHYAVIDWNAKGSATDFTEEQYFKTMQQALRMEKIVKGHINIMDKYDPQNRVALAVDEWGGWYDVEPGTNPGFLYQQNTMRDALLAGATLNIFNNYCRRVKMANLAQTVNVLQAVVLTKEEKIILTPTYHVMEMYNVHHDATMLPVDVTSEKYTVDGKSLDAISCSASKDENGKIHISLVNIDINKKHNIVIDLRGTEVSKCTGRILTSEKVQDHNTFENPEKIKPAAFNGFKLNGNKLRIELPATSVVVLELE